jgi:NhaA family Na+:H+ antiporter
MRREDGSSPVHELEDWLHPYVKFVILPLFAFANAGLQLSGMTMDNLLRDIPLGIVAGLVVGKPLGVLLAAGLLVALGYSRLPDGTSWQKLAGVACLAGIGFTMSLFVGSLAFSSPEDILDVRVGVIVGSLLSTVVGMTLLFTAPAARPSR